MAGSPFGFKARLRRRRSRWRRWLYRLVLLLFVLMLLPALSILGMRWINPPITAFMVQTKLALYIKSQPYGIRHRWVDYADIAPDMRLAVVAAEDQRFPEHGGFDWKAIRRAHLRNRNGERLRGGSTISQQVAKNLFLWRDRSWLRKGIEAYLTVLIEALWPKQRILEVYLNIAQFDQRVFGVGAAARYVYRRTPDRLNRSQAAMLAAVLPAPTRLHAREPSRYLRSRQYAIQRQMQRLGPDYLAGIEQPRE